MIESFVDIKICTDWKVSWKDTNTKMHRYAIMHRLERKETLNDGSRMCIELGVLLYTEDIKIHRRLKTNMRYILGPNTLNTKWSKYFSRVPYA